MEKKQKSKVLVLAGSYREYLMYLREKGLSRRDASYLFDANCLRGRANIKLVKYGRCHLRKARELDEIMVVARYMQEHGDLQME